MKRSFQAMQAMQPSKNGETSNLTKVECDSWTPSKKLCTDGEREVWDVVRERDELLKSMASLKAEKAALVDIVAKVEKELKDAREREVDMESELQTAHK